MLATVFDDLIGTSAGHSRVEEGSEHYVFYELEARLKRPFIHGHIVGLGVYLMTLLQAAPGVHERVTAWMQALGLCFQPKDMGITASDLRACLLNLKSFVTSRPALWYTVLNEVDITPEWVDDALSRLEFA